MRKIFIITLFISTTVLQAQELTTHSKKAARLFEQAKTAYQQLSYVEAAGFADEAVKMDKDFIEAWLLLAQIFEDTNVPEKAIEAYRSAVAINPSFFPNAFLFLAKLEMATGQFNEASAHIKDYTALGKPTVLSASLLKRCQTAIELMQHPVPFNPVNLGPTINSVFDEYWPSLSADEKILVFTTRRPINPNNPRSRSQEDFYISTYNNNAWDKALDMGAPINTPYNEGAQSLSADGRLMVFTGCNRPDGMGLCDLYFSMKENGKWTEPINLGTPINTDLSEKQPSLSPDGRTLYFSSNRPGGHGGMDIWASTLTADDVWGEPVNLGDTINTKGNESSPFIHFDNNSLYFSSDSLPGLGGSDIFLSRRDSAGHWQPPVNLGYPINTWLNEDGLIINALGSKAYFASDRIGQNRLDIFSFDIPRSIAPEPVSYMSGKVSDIRSGYPLEAQFKLIDLQSGKTIMDAYSHKTDGSFLVCIPSGKQYALLVSCKGYIFYSDHFLVPDSVTAIKPYKKNVEMQPIVVGSKTILRNIFFESGSYKLKEESRIELDRIVEFMNNNPTIKIEVSGHTDNEGDDVYNQKLSENRAKEVTNYLIKKNILANRIVTKGYGETQPIAGNEDEEGRAANRRTEFKIIAK
jgi:flagellar motor protein MotB